MQTNPPIIRLEVESMRATILAAFSEYAVQLDADIRAAVEQTVTAEYVTRVLREAAAKEIKAAIEQEVEGFYRYGAGRRALQAAVEATLTRREASR